MLFHYGFDVFLLFTHGHGTYQIDSTTFGGCVRHVYVSVELRGSVRINSVFFVLTIARIWPCVTRVSIYRNLRLKSHLRLEHTN